jgi:uncharacterized DUF497 family protein
MEFDWDDRKNAINKFKHKIDFRDAMGTFFDNNAIIREDYNRHDEIRMHICGKSAVGVLLIVYTELVDDTIKIISARKADKSEHKAYQKGYF